jgi:hypothetical protein
VLYFTLLVNFAAFGIFCPLKLQYSINQVIRCKEVKDQVLFNKSHFGIYLASILEVGFVIKFGKRSMDGYFSSAD